MKGAHNTAITYRYRDGSNYKVSLTVILAGAITLEARDHLIGLMIPPEDDDRWGIIIPGQIGLQDLQNQFYRAEILMVEAMVARQDESSPLMLPQADIERLETLAIEMRATKPMWREDNDHIFHEVTDIALTEAPPTDPRTIAMFIAEVERVKWDYSWLPSFHAEMVANYAESLEVEAQGPQSD